MRYTTIQFFNQSSRLIFDIYAVTISVWKKLKFWDFYWRDITWFQFGPFEFMYHAKIHVRPHKGSPCIYCGETFENSAIGGCKGKKE